MLQWLWHRLIKEKTVFLPIMFGSKKTRQERWNDVDYLKSVKQLEENQVLQMELFDMLSKARADEESAKNQQEWQAKHEAVKAIISITRLPYYANEKINHVSEAKKSTEVD